MDDIKDTKTQLAAEGFACFDLVWLGEAACFFVHDERRNPTVHPTHVLATGPVPTTPAEIARRVRDCGIIGAGGAGFPTYVKFERPTRYLLVNGAESEPGYMTDKLLFASEAETYARLFAHLRTTLGYERIILGAEENARPFLVEIERICVEAGLIEMHYFENLYKYGQERALTKELLGITVPQKGIPPDVGVTVSNNETLFNVARALFDGHPVTTKFVTVFGETPRHLAVEAPVGTPAATLMRLAGLEPGPGLHVFDGGPVLCNLIKDPENEGIRRTTNGILVVAEENLKRRARSYPRADGPPLPKRIENVEHAVSRVVIPLVAGFGTPAVPVVHVGDHVEQADVVGRAVADALSVPAHASISGTVTRVDADAVEILADHIGRFTSGG